MSICKTILLIMEKLIIVIMEMVAVYWTVNCLNLRKTLE